MRTFSQFLTEAIETFYHGSKTPIQQFDLDHLGSGENIDQEGPGIYLTSSFEDACHYGPYVYTVRVKLSKTKLMPEKRRLDPSLIRFLIVKSPDRDDALTNWAENPAIALNMAVNQIMDSYGPNEYREAMEQIWGDFYMHHPKEYLSKMRVKGWDGILLDRSNGIKHFIVFDPGILKITGMVKRDAEGK